MARRPVGLPQRFGSARASDERDKQKLACLSSHLNIKICNYDVYVSLYIIVIVYVLFFVC